METTLDTLNIATLCGSLRQKSLNRQLLRNLPNIAMSDMAFSEVEQFSTLPPYNQDIENRSMPAHLDTIAKRLRSFNGVVIATPEYNHSVPGFFKNTIDWLSRLEQQPFDGKTVSIMAVSPSECGGTRGLDHLKDILAPLGAHVIDDPRIAVHATSETFGDDGVLRDEGVAKAIREHLEALRHMIRERTDQRRSQIA